MKNEASIFSRTFSPAKLSLSSGEVFSGFAFGEEGTLDNPAKGEVVFNTSLYGYQEILTDPSYREQIMCFTNPHIGNVGCNDIDEESDSVHVAGVIIRDYPRLASNFRSQRSLNDYLREARVCGIAGIDTRHLVAILREKGAQSGVIVSGEKATSLSDEDLVDLAREYRDKPPRDLVREVACRTPYAFTELPFRSLKAGYLKLTQEELLGRPHVVAIDCGIKRNILRLLLVHGFRVSVLPATVSAEEIIAYKPDALFISNGPGDPSLLNYLVQSVRLMLGKVPIFGICLGHQVLAQALGGNTYKLKFGHRGGNHPVKDFTTDKIEITVQNHGYAVVPESFTHKADVKITHLNLNDGTIEGLDVPELNAYSIQYHPESSPGPHDSEYLFARFFKRVVRGAHNA
jgi:carbamoyl-phosphate synthase small subunit